MSRSIASCFSEACCSISLLQQQQQHCGETNTITIIINSSSSSDACGETNTITISGSNSSSNISNISNRSNITVEKQIQTAWKQPGRRIMQAAHKHTSFLSGASSARQETASWRHPCARLHPCARPRLVDRRHWRWGEAAGAQSKGSGQGLSPRAADRGSVQGQRDKCAEDTTAISCVKGSTKMEFPPCLSCPLPSCPSSPPPSPLPKLPLQVALAIRVSAQLSEDEVMPHLQQGCAGGANIQWGQY